MKLICLFLASFFIQIEIQAQVQNEPQNQATLSSPSETFLDSLVKASLKTFDVPGIALGIVKDGKLIFAKGYGFRSLNTKLPVDENTLFGIASNSKAFTTTALGILVDQGKLRWEDKVRDYIPEFKLYNPYVTDEFTIKDLVTHRSGMGLGAGDLMFWPDSTDFTFKEVIYNLRFLKQTSSFRSKFDYDNLLYMVAGEVIHRISGITWDEFIQASIFSPLVMEKSATCYFNLKDKSNVIDGHARVDGKVRVIGRSNSTLDHAAGGIYSNITDLSKWVIMHLNEGTYGSNNQRLISLRNHSELWSPQTILPVRSPGPYNTHFGAYGLGFFISDVRGFKQLEHTGGLEGMVTEITMIPELKLGIIVLTNQEVGAAFTSITNQIKDYYLGIKDTHRVSEYASYRDAYLNTSQIHVAKVWKTSDSITKTIKTNKFMDSYLGTFRDTWMGDLNIHLENGIYRLDFKRSPKLSGRLYPYLGNTCLVKWDDHSMDADAYIIFQLNEKGKVSSAKMKPISDLTDFSYDFQDLDLQYKTQ